MEPEEVLEISRETFWGFGFVDCIDFRTTQIGSGPMPYGLLSLLQVLPTGFYPALDRDAIMQLTPVIQSYVHDSIDMSIF